MLDPMLDLRTLAYVIAGLSFTLALLLAVLRTSVPAYLGLFRWSLGTAVIGIGYIIAIQESANQLGWLGILGNSMVAGGVALISRGSWAFLNRSIPIGRLAYLTPLIVLLGGLLSRASSPFIFFGVNYLVLAIQFGVSAAILLYRFPFRRRNAPRYTAVIYGFLGLYFLWESLAAFFSVSNKALSIPRDRPLLVMSVGLVAWTIGLIFMTLVRLADELAEHEQENARRERYRMLKTIIDSLPLNVILKDRDSRYLACNAAFAKTVHKETEAIIGLNDYDLFPKDLADKYRADDQIVMNEDTIHEFREQSHQEEQLTWVETIKVPVHDTAGKVDGVLSAFYDVTKRLQAERALQESERRYRELSANLERRVEERSRELWEARHDIEIYFEVTPDFFCLMDFDGRLKKLSPAWIKELGWPETELIGQELASLLHPSDQAIFRNMLPGLKKGGKRQDLKTRLRARGGAWLYLSWTCVGVPERNMVIGAAHDISAQMEAAKKFSFLAEEAERASNAKSLFISTMSHELRTPLNAILGYGALLSDFVQNDKAKSYLKSLEGAGRSLLAIINDLLDITKAESGRIELRPSPADPRLVLLEVADLFRFDRPDKNLNIIMETNDSVPATVFLDAERLRQIIINLVGNAVKFTETGEVRVFMSAEPSSDTTQDTQEKPHRVSLRIQISDTGIGMSEGYVDRLFETFSQENETIARRYGGTGLGLAIAKRLLDLMDATISCDSEPGKGTRFDIIIPNLTSSGSGSPMRLDLTQPAAGPLKKL